jgi:hypothetical protein
VRAATNAMHFRGILPQKAVMRFLFVGFTLLLASSFTVPATPLHDPEILIDTGGDSIPISTGINQAQPCGSAPCIFDFFNDTGGILISFTFETMINPGLSSAAAASFTCADPSGFFLSCSSHYDPSGDLKYMFTGVLPEDQNETSGPDLGEHEGIPPGADFIIEYEGWVRNQTVGNEQLYQGLPTMTNTFATTATPEPSAALTFATGLLLLAALWNRRRPVR